MTTEAPPAPEPTSTQDPSAGGFLAAPAGNPPSDPNSPPPPSTFFGEHIVGKDGRFNEGWSESLARAGFERLATKAGMAPDEPTFFRSLDEALGLIGKKAAPAYPGPGATDADISAYRSSAGIPDTPEAYNLKPDTLPPGIEWNETSAKEIAEIFHQHHIPEATAKALLAKHLETTASIAGQSSSAIAAKMTEYTQASMQTFRQEWGDAFDTRLEANQAFVQSRFSEADLADPAIQTALAHPQIVRMIDEARRNLREAPLPGVTSSHGIGSMSPAQQAQEIMRANPQWDRDPDLARRVNDLYALDAKQARSRSR